MPGDNVPLPSRADPRTLVPAARAMYERGFSRSRVLQEIYLPAFQTAIEKGGAAAVMCAYSNVNNLPSCQNPSIVTCPAW